jgi:cytochrome d ubiquinol oxidase subunit I
VLLVHLAFQVMVGAGFALIALGLWFWWVRWKRPDLEGRWLLRALAMAAPLGFIALEAGWMVTELGRQPWTIYGIMRTSQAVTPATHVATSFLVFTVLYLGLAVVLVVLLLRLAKGSSAVPSSATESKAEAAHGS